MWNYLEYLITEIKKVGLGFGFFVCACKYSFKNHIIPI